MKILLDTNFCLLTLKNSWYMEELRGDQLILTDFIIREIEKTSEKHETIMEKLKQENVRELKTGLEPKNNDDALLKTAIKIKAGIATNDSELREKARKKGVQTIYLRQKKMVIKG